MSADLSRVRFDPLRDHAGVGLQQGRLLLDADWNEQVALVDRRLRAQVADLVPGRPTASGGAATPAAPTPAAFQVTASGGTLSIGAGRMYVDGLLAENHGDPVDGFDPVLAGRAGSRPVDYAKQPYWPTPEMLPTGGTAVAFLDVWQREVTPLQAPDLVEPAVGVDTTVRAQTVWQVRLLTNVGDNVDCETPLDRHRRLDRTDRAVGRPADHRHGTGGPRRRRLRAAALRRVPRPGEPDVPRRAARGRGRAKVPATFKWSRDNASVGSAVTQVVSGTQLVLGSLGRDDVLRFNSGDWVEITDDHRELNRQAGELRQVTVDDATATITFSPALPADLIPTGTEPDTVAAGHLRVTRWDQSGQVRTVDGTLLVDLDAAGATGEVPVPADGSAVVLERGVTVAFSFVDKGLGRVGDHWIAAARTADASIEKLLAAPPLGIHHHYARLAVLSLPDGATDCRLPDPVAAGGEDCACKDCEICVTEESHKGGSLTIQDAVARLAQTGGTVIICPGTYVLREPLRLDNARSLTVRGAGPGTVLVSDGPAVVANGRPVRAAAGYADRGGAGAGGRPADQLSRLRAAWGVRVRHAGAGRRRHGRGGTGGRRAAHGHPRMPAGGAQRHRRGIAGEARRRRGRAAHPAHRGPAHPGQRAAVWERGINLGGTCVFLGELTIAGNTVAGPGRGGHHRGRRARPAAGHGGSGAARVLTPPGGAAGTAQPGHRRLRARHRGQRRGGRGGQPGRGGRTAGRPQRHLAGRPAAGRTGGHGQVVGNRVAGFGGAGITVQAPLASVLVKLNTVRGCGQGIVTQVRGDIGNVSIDNNHILDLTAPRAGRSSPVAVAAGG